MRYPPLLYAVFLLTCGATGSDANPLRDQLEIARERKDRDAQRELLLRLLTDEAANVELLRDLAAIQLESREYSRCDHTVARLEAALGKPDAGVLEMRGDLATGTAKSDAERAQAADWWVRGLALEPENVRLLTRLAAHHQQARRPESEALYRQRLAGLRDHPADHAALARAAVGRRDWGAAMRHSSHLREKHANRAEAKTWAATYDRLMKETGQLAALDARLEVDLTSVPALLERAWLFDSIGIGELALQDARRAHKLDAGSLAVRYQLAVIMAHNRQAHAALEECGVSASRYSYKQRRPSDAFFAKLTELEGRAEAGDASALAARSNLLRGEGQNHLACADARAAVAADPNLFDAQLALARCEGDADHTRAAKAAYDAALQIDSNHLDALAELAALHMRLGDYADAAPLLKHHLELDPQRRLESRYELCFSALQKSKP